LGRNEELGWGGGMVVGFKTGVGSGSGGQVLRVRKEGWGGVED